LAAEKSGRVEPAERALRDLFAMLADPLPGAGFAGRVLARLEPTPTVVPIGIGWRLALAACLMLAGLWIAYLPLVVMPLIDAARVGQVVGLLGSALVTGSQMLVGWLSFWESLGAVNRVLVTMISKPPVALTLVVLAGLTALSFRFLSDLLAEERSTHHA